MHALLPAFTPIWMLTAVGYAAGRGGLLGARAADVLGRFVFHVAMPAALFTMVSGTHLGAFANASMVAFATGTALTCGLGFLAAGRLFGRGTADRTIGAMASGYVNSANLGIPVAVQVLGDASFVAQIILFQVLLVAPVILTSLDAATRARAGAISPGGDGTRGADGGTGGTGGGTRGADGDGAVSGARPGPGVVVRRMLAVPVRNPIILASFSGVVVSALGLRLPYALAHSCDLLGAAAVPTALVTLGLSLNRRASADGSAPGGARENAGTEGAERTRRAEVALVVVLKTLVQPLIAFAVAGPLLHLPDRHLLAVVLCSALPTAQNVFVYAQQYGLDTRSARDCVVASTVVSMATLSLATLALGTVS
ncbi:AEC family transporter [Streptomyces sp. NPDC014734]|uniref:AEC family transporter n=1 Tax=Streptomyces sp. NPDC014734 TaxID=3364886 RepID=UPI0036FC0DD1